MALASLELSARQSPRDAAVGANDARASRNASTFDLMRHGCVAAEVDGTPFAAEPRRHASTHTWCVDQNRPAAFARASSFTGGVMSSPVWDSACAGARRSRWRACAPPRLPPPPLAPAQPPRPAGGVVWPSGVAR